MFDPKPHLIQLPRRVKDRQTGQWTTRFDDYLEVRWRAYWFRERYPHGSIVTEALSLDWERGVAVYKATVGDGEGGTATGTGTEIRTRFEDFVEKAETRAVGRALALLGFGTQFVGEELSEDEHIADAPVPAMPETASNGQPAPLSPAEREGRISRDEARTLKQTVQAAYGFAAGEAKLREDLGLEADKALTLMRLQAHVSPAQYAALMDAYQTHLKQTVEEDVPDHPLHGQPEQTPNSGSVAEETTADDAPGVGAPAPEVNPEARLRWGALSGRSLRVGLSPSVWDSLRQAGDYASAERVIAALEQTAPNGGA